MALVGTFAPPHPGDLPAGSPFYDAWHDLVAGTIDDYTPGVVRGEFVDPSAVDVDVLAHRAVPWTGFPRYLLVRHRDDRHRAFCEGEIRNVVGNQFEYLEWHVTRNEFGRITKVVFVTELLEYWDLLARTNPQRLVELYRELVHPDVEGDDLFLEREGTRSYDPYNRWNIVNGIVHYVVGINNLPLAVGVAEGGLAEAAPDGFAVAAAPDVHAADERLRRDVGAVARRDLSVILREPVTLTIGGWDDTGWTKPDGSPVGDYWRVTRGTAEAPVRLEYEVPPEEGFVVADIAIGGRPIEFGGQLAEHVTVTVHAAAGRRAS